jgi:hypothetical protein
MNEEMFDVVVTIKGVVFAQNKQDAVKKVLKNCFDEVPSSSLLQFDIKAKAKIVEDCEQFIVTI